MSPRAEVEIETAPASARDEDLAKKLQNPVASLISAPFQNNWDFGFGLDGKGWRYTVNIQPVIPVSISQDWNVIVRTILPVIYQSDISAHGRPEGGLGDTVQSFFLSPKNPGPLGVIWGAGPVFLYPTATDHFLGAGKWGAGRPSCCSSNSMAGPMAFLPITSGLLKPSVAAQISAQRFCSRF